MKNFVGNFLLVSCSVVLCALVFNIGDVQGVCRDTSQWCPQMTRRGACGFYEPTRTQCPRQCGLCQVKCKEVNVTDRADCGHHGIDRKACEMRGCCFMPLEKNSNEPWCFFPQDHCKFVEVENRTDCGHYGIKRNQCLDKGCCWSPVATKHPWCHHSV